jgi:hypothetical protein
MRQIWSKEVDCPSDSGRNASSPGRTLTNGSTALAAEELKHGY